jgi:hypothetical protein
MIDDVPDAQQVERDMQRMPRFSSEVNRDHLAQTLFTSRCWITYSIIQTIVALALILVVVADIRTQR